MDHGRSNSTVSCEMGDMLWNWTTINACFLTSSWHISNRGTFAASCIGVALLGVLLEVLRRIGRDYELIIRKQLDRHGYRYKITPIQQGIRTIIHTTTFAIAYLLMLLAMSYNGYILISIVLGVGVGFYLCDRPVGDCVEEKRVTRGDDGMMACCG